MRTVATSLLLVATLAAAAAGCTSPSAASDATAVPAAPSAGCADRMIDIPGQERITFGDGRWFLRRIPPTEDEAQPLPLVIDLHGYAEGAEHHLDMSALGPFGDEHGFVTVTPQGGGAIAQWAAAAGSPDVEFIAAVIDDTERSVCIDRNRIYVAGISMGAFMAAALACDLSERVAAVALVAGVRDIAGCAPTRPVSVVAFHGTDDDFVSYEGGLGEAVAGLPAPDGSGRTIGELGLDERAGFGASVPEVMAAWAERSACRPTTTEDETAPDVTRIRFDCPPPADVELYRIDQGGHAWPGSARSAALADLLGPTTTSVSANEIMWQFFQRHPLMPAPLPSLQ